MTEWRAPFFFHEPRDTSVNPDALDSPMAIIKATLTDLLNEHARSQAEMLRAQQDQSRVSAHTRPVPKLSPFEIDHKSAA